MRDKWWEDLLAPDLSLVSIEKMTVNCCSSWSEFSDQRIRLTPASPLQRKMMTDGTGRSLESSLVSWCLSYFWVVLRFLWFAGSAAAPFSVWLHGRVLQTPEHQAISSPPKKGRLSPKQRQNVSRTIKISPNVLFVWMLVRFHLISAPLLLRWLIITADHMLLHHPFYLVKCFMLKVKTRFEMLECNQCLLLHRTAFWTHSWLSEGLRDWKCYLISPCLHFLGCDATFLCVQRPFKYVFYLLFFL